MSVNRLSKWAVLLAAAWLGRLGWGAEAADAAVADVEAGSIVATAGFKGGLCLHLGCGRPGSAGLTAALAQVSGMPVHGLGVDAAAVERARAIVARRELSGRAMIEKLTPGALPYVSDLARLIVVEEMALLTKSGIARAEAMRVLAPGGVMCVKEGGKWSFAAKPRPPEMDEWTHPHHGPDGVLASSDRTIAFPIDLRWVDGVPFGRGGFAQCAPCRAIVLAGGRCFTVNNDELGSNGHALLQARDAYSGFPLWKVDCQAVYSKVELDWRNVWPLAAGDRLVYAARTNDIIAVDAASGAIAFTCPTAYQPRRLLLSDGCLVVASWERMVLNDPKDGYENDGIRGVWWPDGGGRVETFDAANGRPKWSMPLTALTVFAREGMVYMLSHSGNPPVAREVVAVDLATGRERWRVPHTAFGEEPDTCLNFAGPGCVVVSKTRRKERRAVFVLGAADGKVLVHLSNTVARAIVGGELWCSDGRYELLTGRKGRGPGVAGTYAGGNIVGGCVPPIVVGSNMVTSSRGGKYLHYRDDPAKPPVQLAYPGARGACLTGMIPANGMFYTAQNNCACFGAQIGGFLAVGAVADNPGEDEFGQARPVEQGPAWGAVPDIPAGGDWPTYRQNAERSGGTTNRVADAIRLLWSVACAPRATGAFATAWNARLGAPQPLTAPVAAGGMVVIAAVNAGQVIALHPDTGAVIWTAQLGSRIDSPPTFHKGLLLVGCHDGWVYGLRARDGATAYRMRAAPRERRVMAYGMVESAWPATGAILVHDGLAYVAAGRSSEMLGGIAWVAFKPETGETVWTKLVGAQAGSLMDLFSIRDGELAWRWQRFDARTGQELAPAQRYHGQVGMLDGSWAAGYSKRSGGGFALGRIFGSMLAWNEHLLIGAGWAVDRASARESKPAANAAPKHQDRLRPEEYVWRTELEPHIEWARVNAMALTGNAALYAGSVFNGWRNGRYDGSFIWIKSAADGKTRQKEIKLEAPPSYDAMAVAGGRIYLALQNGMLQCWGE